MTMMDWCTEHPWMTFFIALVLVEEVGRLARAIVKRKKDAK
jgi:hypothetical protein